MDRLDSIFMEGLAEQKRETEERIAALNKKIERIERAGFWKKLLSLYLNYLKRQRDELERWHFRYSLSESIGKGREGETKGNPELAAKVFFRAFKD